MELDAVLPTEGLQLPVLLQQVCSRGGAVRRGRGRRKGQSWAAMIAVRAPYERWADTAPAAGFRSLTRQPSSAAPSNGAQPPAPGAPPELLCSSAGLTCATSSSRFICSRLKLETPAARSFFSRISCSSAAQLQAGGRGKGQGGAGGQGFSTCGGANMAGSPSLIQCVAIAGWQAPHHTACTQATSSPKHLSCQVPSGLTPPHRSPQHSG